MISSILDNYGLYHIEPNKEGKYKNGHILPKSHSKILFYTSFLCLPSIYYAIYRGHYDFVHVPLGVFITSFLYWDNPKKDSFQRKLDITYVAISLLYQFIRAFWAENGIYYYIFVILALSLYPIGNYYQNKHLGISVLFHAFLHLFANISNIALYSGEIASIL
jgi:hypothetical protein